MRAEKVKQCPTVKFFLDAGEGIGMGHLSRCCAVAEGFSELGITAAMHVNCHGSQCLHLVSDSKFPMSVQDWQSEVEKLARGFCPIIIIDSYLITTEQINFLAKSCAQLVVMDDHLEADYPPGTLVINTSPIRSPMPEKWAAVHLLSGSDYIAIRREVKQAPSLPMRENIVKVLVSLGGSDYRNLSKALSLNLAEGNFSIVTVGEKHGLAESGVLELGYLDVATLSTVISDSDFVICAGGQTLHELAYLGKSCFAICIDNDQVLNIRQYTALGYLTGSAWWNDAHLFDRIDTAVAAHQSLQMRVEKALLGQKIIDGKGASRIARQIVKRVWKTLELN